MVNTRPAGSDGTRSLLHGLEGLLGGLGNNLDIHSSTPSPTSCLRTCRAEGACSQCEPGLCCSLGSSEPSCNGLGCRRACCTDGPPPPAAPLPPFIQPAHYRCQRFKPVEAMVLRALPRTLPQSLELSLHGVVATVQELTCGNASVRSLRAHLCVPRDPTGMPAQELLRAAAVGVEAVGVQLSCGARVSASLAGMELGTARLRLVLTEGVLSLLPGPSPPDSTHADAVATATTAASGAIDASASTAEPPSLRCGLTFVPHLWFLDQPMWRAYEGAQLTYPHPRSSAPPPPAPHSVAYPALHFLASRRGRGLARLDTQRHGLRRGRRRAPHCRGRCDSRRRRQRWRGSGGGACGAALGSAAARQRLRAPVLPRPRLRPAPPQR